MKLMNDMLHRFLWTLFPRTVYILHIIEKIVMKLQEVLHAQKQ